MMLAGLTNQQPLQIGFCLAMALGCWLPLTFPADFSQARHWMLYTAATATLCLAAIALLDVFSIIGPNTAAMLSVGTIVAVMTPWLEVGRRWPAAMVLVTVTLRLMFGAAIAMVSFLLDVQPQRWAEVLLTGVGIAVLASAGWRLTEGNRRPPGPRSR